MSSKLRSVSCLWILSSSVLFSGCGSDDDSATRQIASAGSNGSGGSAGSTGTGGSAGKAAGGAAIGPMDFSCDVDDGQCIFRNDTFGDEKLWTDTLRLHEVVQGLPPTMALAVGLKVDSEAVPAEVLANADLDAPETTVALLGLGAVVGVRAKVEDGTITSIGISCALCHSTVDDSVMPGVGKRLDGWPNRDLNAGAIIALTPGLPAMVEPLGVTAEQARTALESWGPGRYDARFNQDTENHPVLIPPAYGLSDVALETYTGEGPVSYWNAYVAITQMGGQGTFMNEDLGLEITADPDLVTPRLAALREYQFSLMPPVPVADSFDAAAAERGAALFEGSAQCASCHSGASYSDAPMLHAPAETGMDENEARRSVTKMYRTTPLRGVATHSPFFHDGSAPELEDVVEHYNTTLELGLAAEEMTDLVEYLKSL